MTHQIAFPGLGLSFTLDRVAFRVFGWPIYWYGLIICLGFILGGLYLRARAERYGFNMDQVGDCLLVCVPLGFVCARIYYVIFEWGYYSQHLIEIPQIWQGGIAIYGGVIGTVLGLWLYAKKNKLSLVTLCDFGAPALLIGQAIGRWGNFVNAEAHGGPTELPWRMSIDGGAGVHPTFFYESLWNLIGFALLFYMAGRKQPKGKIALLYTAWYGFGRMFIEGLRTDSLYIADKIRVSQVVAGVSLVAAVVLLVLIEKHEKNRRSRGKKTEQTTLDAE